MLNGTNIIGIEMSAIRYFSDAYGLLRAHLRQERARCFIGQDAPAKILQNKCHARAYYDNTRVTIEACVAYSGYAQRDARDE